MMGWGSDLCYCRYWGVGHQLFGLGDVGLGDVHRIIGRSRAEGRAQRAEGRGQGAKSKGQGAGRRGQSAKSKEQRAEGRARGGVGRWQREGKIWMVGRGG